MVIVNNILWLHLLVEGVNVVDKDAGDVAVDKHDVLEEDERALQGVGVVHLHHQQPLQRLLHNVPLVRACQPDKKQCVL